jgi:hypothetical protein
VHHYPLHRRVLAACDCCALDNDFVFRSASETVICKGCQRHTGGSPRARQLRDSDHAALFFSEVQLLREQLSQARAVQRDDYQRILTALESQLEARTDELARNAEVISGLRAALRDGEIGAGLAAWLGDEELAEAQTERDSARRATSLVLEAVSRLALIHGTHPARPHYCVCGNHVDRCPEYQAIESELKVVGKWEREQLERYRDGLDHRLSPEKLQSLIAATDLRREA